MRDEDREGSIGTTHLFVSSLFAFCVRSLQRLFYLKTRDVLFYGKWEMRTPVKEDGKSL